jgi:prepilin-type N-terminal cleavage/methylation domain-containing protein
MKSAITNFKSQTGFTLIELLVVITIIVILMALLTPAMDQAIYQAELAVCAAQMNGVAKGVTVYAIDFNRSYPHRQYVAEGQSDTTSVYPWLLRKQETGGRAHPIDDRLPLRGYVAMKMLVDPLGKTVDLDHPNSWIYSSYNLWFGWTYSVRGPDNVVLWTRVAGQGMTKIGNRLEWTDGVFRNKSYSVDWLITDGDNPNPTVKFIVSGHPDELGLLHNLAVEAGKKDNPDAQTQAANTLPDSETASRWVWWQGWDRGEMEMNAAAADGSVSRYNDVRSYKDERMAYAPKTPASGLAASGSATTREGSAPTEPVPQYYINVPAR